MVNKKDRNSRLEFDQEERKMAIDNILSMI